MANSDVKKKFGKSVRDWRHQLGFSQEQLAERADLHRTYVSDVERGARNVSLESIEKLARALKIPVSTLFNLAGKSPEDHPLDQALSADEMVEILYIEDNPNDAELALRALKHAKISNRIYVVRDGEEALEFLFCQGQYAHRCDSDNPRLILLDLNLPKITGFEVLAQVRANPQTRDIPVVILTASKADRDFIESKRLAVEAYIVKPVDFQNLSHITPQLNLQWALLKSPPAVKS